MSQEKSGPGIRVVLGGETRAIADVDPTTTVLEWLRAQGRCGTKEGCAEGDCGACTVVLAEAGADGLNYRAINSCIQFVPTLDGKALITVEDLAHGATLHPVQRAIVDCHGSQCGFCTPGFVMALFALGRNQLHADRATVERALAGNLCRCTGYRPILDAAARMHDRAGDPFDARAGGLQAKLERIKPGDLAYEATGKKFWAPTTKAALFKILADHPDAQILAGGTDFGLWVTKQHREFAKIVYLGRVRDLHDVRSEPAGVTIGGAATWSAAFAALAALHPDLDPYLARFASTQIRNAGTVGGNIANASPIGDGPPVLIALGASVTLEGAGGARTMPLDQFFLDYRKTALKPGEIVAAIHIPRPATDARFAAYKLSKRFDQDISTVAAGFMVTIAGGMVRTARLAFGGMAAVPKRATKAEAAMVGRPWTLATIQAAMTAIDADFTPMTDMRGSAAYRKLAARNLLLRFYREGGEALPRVTHV